MRSLPLIPATVAGSLPKPAWLAEPEKLWAAWRPAARSSPPQSRTRPRLAQDPGGCRHRHRLRRRAVPHPFRARLPRADRRHRLGRKTKMGIRNNRYVVGGADGHRTGRAARADPSRRERASPAPIPSAQLKFTLPGPMTICDTIADAHYGRRADMAMAFAEAAQRGGARARGARRRRHPVRRAGLQRLHGGRQGLGHRGARSARPRASRARPRSTSATATASRPTSSGRRRSARSGGNTRRSFPALNTSRIDQVSLECAGSKVPMSLIGLLDDKEILVGAIDVATNTVETPEEVAATLREALDTPIRSAFRPAPIAGWRRCRAPSP